MELSAELFADILASAPGGVQPPAGVDERRRAPRPVMRFDAKIICRTDGAAPRVVQTTIRDFSQRGVGLVHGSTMQRGQQFVLMLPGVRGNVSLLCTVTHVAATEGLTHNIGAEFVCPLDPAKPEKALEQVDELERIRKSILTW